MKAFTSAGHLFEGFRYLVMSGLSSILSLGIPFLLHEVFGVRPDIAVACGLTAAFIMNSFTARLFVFRKKGSVKQQLGRFALVSFAFRSAEYLAFLVLHSALGVQYMIANASVLFLSFCLKFFVYKIFVFIHPEKQLRERICTPRLLDDPTSGTDEALMTPATPHATSAPPRGVPFQQVLLLCVPALIVGLVFRISFLIAIPEVYYGSDSNSYFDAAWRLWTHGDFTLNPKRRFLYPIVLIFMPLLPGSVAVGTAVVQHLLGLVIIIGIGWVVAQMTRLPNLWVPLVTCVAAIWPRMLWYEHEIIARSLATRSLRCRGRARRAMWLAQGPKTVVSFISIATAAIVACKPHGRPLWLGLMVVAIAMAGNPLKWERKASRLWRWPSCHHSHLWQREARKLALLEFDTSVCADRGRAFAEYRAILAPLVEKARTDLPNYAAQQSRYKKILKR